MERKRQMAGIVFLVGLLVLSMVTYAGSLEPTAPPGPTMKTLDAVEPRTPIYDLDVPLTISESGSYYFAEDITFGGTVDDAITIESNDVTIDLAGYTLKGGDFGAKSGIYMSGRTNVEIRNGTVRDFMRGIWEDSSTGRQHRIINVRAVSNRSSGIILSGYGHLIKGCTATDNTTSGIDSGDGCTVTSNTACYNGSDGIYGGNTCTVSRGFNVRCTAVSQTIVLYILLLAGCGQRIEHPFVASKRTRIIYPMLWLSPMPNPGLDIRT
jgi:hypothetical protein